MHYDLWKMMLGGAVLVVPVVFVGIGMGHVINPERFGNRVFLRQGGETLQAWNRFGVRVAGAAFASTAAYILYQVFRSWLDAQ